MDASSTASERVRTSLDRELLERIRARYPQLRAINLSRNGIKHIENLDVLSYLTKLNLSENGISRLENLEVLPGLQELEVHSNAISDIAEGCKALKALHTVDLSNNNLQTGPWLHVLAALPALCSLKLQGNPVSNSPGYRVMVASLMPHLQELDGLPLRPAGGSSEPSTTGANAGSTATQAAVPGVPRGHSTVTAGPPGAGAIPPGVQGVQPTAKLENSAPVLMPEAAWPPSGLSHTQQLGGSPGVEAAAAAAVHAHEARAGQGAWTGDTHRRAAVPEQAQQTMAALMQQAAEWQVLHAQEHAQVRLLSQQNQAMQSALEEAQLERAQLQEALAQASAAMQDAAVISMQLETSMGQATELQAQVKELQAALQAAEARASAAEARAEQAEARTGAAEGAASTAEAAAAADAVEAAAAQAEAEAQRAAEGLGAGDGSSGAHSGALQEEERAAFEARLGALQRIVELQQRELARLGAQQLSSGSLSAEDVLGAWRVALERESAAARAAEESLARYKAAWAGQLEGMQQQFEAAQALLQVLEQRATAHKAELVQARAQAAAAEETLAAERRDRARLAEEAAAREQDVKAAMEQMRQFAHMLEARMQQAEASAAAAVDALSRRLQYAKSRMSFSLHLARQSGSSNSSQTLGGPPASGSGSYPYASGAGKASGSALGARAAESAGNLAVVGVLQGEIERLTADRDKLLNMLSSAHVSREEHVRQAVAAVQQEEARARARMIEAAVKERLVEEQAEVRRQALAQRQALATAQAEAQAAISQAVQDVDMQVRVVEGRLGVLLSGYEVRLQTVLQQAARLRQLIPQLWSKVQKKEEEAAEAREQQAQLQAQLKDAQAALAAAQGAAAQQADETGKALQEQLAAEQRKAAEAEREAAKAVVLARQLERQLSRLKDKRSTEAEAALADLQARLDAKEEALRTVRRERNALLSVLRQNERAAASASTKDAAEAKDASQLAARKQPLKEPVLAGAKSGASESTQPVAATTRDQVGKGAKPQTASSLQAGGQGGGAEEGQHSGMSSTGKLRYSQLHRSSSSTTSSSASASSSSGGVDGHRDQGVLRPGGYGAPMQAAVPQVQEVDGQEAVSSWSQPLREDHGPSYSAPYKQTVGAAGQTQHVHIAGYSSGAGVPLQVGGHQLLQSGFGGMLVAPQAEVLRVVHSPLIEVPNPAVGYLDGQAGVGLQATGGSHALMMRLQELDDLTGELLD